MRVIERGHAARLALETRPRGRVGRQVPGEDLDRDLAAQPRVLRAIDLTHATGAERRGDFVGSEAGSGCQRHRRTLAQSSWRVERNTLSALVPTAYHVAATPSPSSPENAPPLRARR